MVAAVGGEPAGKDGDENKGRVQLSRLFHQAAATGPVATRISGMLCAEGVAAPSSPGDGGGDEAADEEIQQLRQLHARILQEEKMQTCCWWDALMRKSLSIPPHSLHMVQQGVAYGNHGVIAIAGPVSIWIGLHWLREQRRAGRPLQCIHGSFQGLGEESLGIHLIDLMSTEGCRLAVYHPEMARGNLLVTKYFTIHFEGL